MRLTYLVSSDYARTTGGWIYNERLLKELDALGWRIDRVELPAGFPDPSDDALRAALQITDNLPDGALVLGDQVCLAPLSLWMLLEGQKHRFAIIVHHPQILEGSRSPALAARLDADERQAIDAADCVIATSRLTGRQLKDGYGATPDRLLVAEPGTDVFPASPGSGSARLNLLSIGSVIPRKRHELIVGTLAGLLDLDWRCIIAGSVTMVPEHAAMLRDLVAERGLDGRVTLLGAVTGAEVEALWSSADVYVAASAHEGFGMAVAEAVARQVPVVTTRSGAVADWLSPAAAVIVPTDDAAAMSAALRSVIADGVLRAGLREGAEAARAGLATWAETAGRVDARLRELGR